MTINYILPYSYIGANSASTESLSPEAYGNKYKVLQPDTTQRKKWNMYF